MDAHALGKLCIERGLISEEQLRRCLELQRTGERWRRLGEILLEQGLVTGSGFATLLDLQRGRRAHEEPESEPVDPPTHELGWLLREARAWGADAVILGTGQTPAFRSGGRIEPLEGPPLQAGQVEQMLAEAFPGMLLQRLQRERHISMRCLVDAESEVSVDAHRCRGGVGLVVRPILGAPRSLDGLGLPSQVAEFIEHADGLVLITGPAGSGRRTTMFALLEQLNATRPVQIDVVERVPGRRLRAATARITHRTAGHRSEAFHQAVLDALRGEADVIALDGPGRPSEIAAALDAADAGRLVLATLPTRSAVTSLQWILHAFGSRDSERRRAQLARCLRGVVCQQVFEARDDEPPVLAAEMMPCTPGIGQEIRAGRVERIPSILQADRSGTMVLLEQSLAALVRRGRVTYEEAMAHANDPQALQRRLNAQREAAHGSA